MLHQKQTLTHWRTSGLYSKSSGSIILCLRRNRCECGVCETHLDYYVKGKARSTAVEKTSAISECSVVWCSARRPFTVQRVAPRPGLRAAWRHWNALRRCFSLTKTFPVWKRKTLPSQKSVRRQKEPADLNPWTVPRKSGASGDYTQKRRRRE